MTRRIRPAFVALTVAASITAASAQNVMVYLFDRLEQPAYAKAWSNMLAGQHGSLPPWLANRAKGAVSGAGHRAVIEGRDAEFYYACQPHNCADSRFGVMFLDRGAKAKGVLVEGSETPRFFGHPDATEAAALIEAAK